VLTANLHFVVDGKVGTGQGEIIWLGPGHYRETYSVPGYNYTEIAKDGERYISRTGDQLPLVMYELKTMLARAMQPNMALTGKIKSVTTMQDTSGQTLTCPQMKSNSEILTACLDGEGDVATMKKQVPAAQAALNASYEFSNFGTVGLRRFPLNMKFHGGDGHEIVVAVQKIAPIVDVGAQHFAVPIGSMEEPWCAEPKTTTNAALPTPGIDILTPVEAALYIEVAPGGRPRYVTVMHSSRPISQKDRDAWATGMHFPIEECGEDGIEYQLEMSITAPPSVPPRLQIEEVGVGEALVVDVPRRSQNFSGDVGQGAGHH
jgi:hypothetical protein